MTMEKFKNQIKVSKATKSSRNRSRSGSCSSGKSLKRSHSDENDGARSQRTKLPVPASQ